ncbi:conserved hypothetical protein [Rippkaea orientalis PCC 8801]|uniref:OstA family protein n=1 Tax=Rippkaea orientalis (strain PCC 8801 / RF-1) TaxID=41431 RepID=B7JZ40_RIPO1|nr:DUF3769 domain-containing protein [Rippkaea orientalis]ACK67251.1 conserved hypothetical protein [Rippkaea orientalis PCC 8801]
MPPFVPPPNPPALIKTVAVNPQSDRLEGPHKGLPASSLMGQKTLISQIPIPIQASPLPTAEEVKPQTTPPAVVEFYFSDPQNIPASSGSPIPPSAEDKADLLGNPISVGDHPQPNTHSSPNAPSAAIKAPPSVVLGLNGDKTLQPNQAHLLVTRKRGGKTQQFQIKPPLAQTDNPTPTNQQEFEIFPDNPSETAPPVTPQEPVGVVELIADRQEYDSVNEVVYAEGNVIMRFTNGVLLADRLRVNLPDQFVVAEGKVVLERGEQTLRGERFEYYFVQDKGIVFNANGEIYQPTTRSDFSAGLPSDITNTLIPNDTLNERLAANQPLQRITGRDGVSFGSSIGLGENSQGVGSNIPDLPTPQGRGRGGQINRIRFQAEQMEFDGDGWRATNARLSNDPFSPPELEIQAETATFRNIAPLVDEVKLTNSRVVIDQENSFPTQDRLILDRRDRQPGVISFGYDNRDRGGFYVERGFNLIDNDTVSWEIKPQYYLQKGIDPEGITNDDPNTDLYLQDKDDIDAISPPTFGFVNRFEANLSPDTNLFIRTSVTSLDFDEQFEDRVRAKAYIQQKVEAFNSVNDVRLEYNFRERLFNGSLGFQTVRDSLGVIFVSPQIPLDNQGLQLSYQASIQNVNADTDQIDLLPPIRDNNRVTLLRAQGAASISRPFILWAGQPLPATPDEGLRYTPVPIQPFVQLWASVTGVGSIYGNGDSQPSISGSIGFSGQVGHFSRPFLDYTGFNITFSQALRGDPSPFLFDRYADLKVISFALTQQIYGPVRFGVQSALNIDTNEEINTDLFLEYSRRTYSILLRYNTVLQVGSINLRISDFNWSGNPGPFDGTGIRPVIQGVPR